MVMHYPSPAEVRRGGWLTHAGGGIKTKGVPVGPRPESLKRILERADDAPSLFCEGGNPDDAPDVRREVGSGRRNDARDVIAVKRALHGAGLYAMPCPAAPSPSRRPGQKRGSDARGFALVCGGPVHTSNVGV